MRRMSPHCAGSPIAPHQPAQQRFSPNINPLHSALVSPGPLLPPHRPGETLSSFQYIGQTFLPCPKLETPAHCSHAPGFLYFGESGGFAPDDTHGMMTKAQSETDLKILRRDPP